MKISSWYLFSIFVDTYIPTSEKAMATHSSTLAWKIPWLEEPGRLQFMGSRRVRHDWATSLSLFTFMHWRKKRTHSIVLAWRIPGTGEAGGLPSMGLHRVRHDWSDLAAAAAAAQDREINIACNPNTNRTGIFLVLLPLATCGSFYKWPWLIAFFWIRVS